MLNIKNLIISFFNKKSAKKIDIEVPLHQNNENSPSIIQNNINHCDKVYEYTKKETYMSKCERNFYQKLLPLKNEGFNIETQINLSTIVKKCYKDTGFETKYRNELFRNIDYGIFTADYQLLVLIELNDSSHNANERKIRDQRVNEICQKANIKLLTFRTSMPNENSYVLNRINLAIKEVLNLKDEPFIKVISVETIFDKEMLNKIDYQKRLQRIKN